MNENRGLKPSNVNDFLIHELKLVAINMILIQLFSKVSNISY